jgi:hypothetical protein
LQAQLKAIEERVAARDAENAGDPDYTPGPRQAEQQSINALNTRIASVVQAITTAEARGPQQLSAPADQQFIVRQLPSGALEVTPNQNWDGRTKKSTTGTIGNKVYTVDQDGKITIAYTDTDAQELAGRQTAVAEANQKLAEARAKTEDFIARAKLDLEERVARGEDAASIRAQQAQDLGALHQEWVRADGDARRQSEALRDYNTTRHQDAADTLARDQLEQTQRWQAEQAAISREQLAAQREAAQQGVRTAQMQTQANLTNQRLQSGSGYMSNVLNMLQQMNQTVDPGSSAIASMLMPLLNVGRGFFEQLGGLTPTADVLATGTSPAAATPAPASVAPAALPPPGTPAPVVAPAPAPAPVAATPAAVEDDFLHRIRSRLNQDVADQGIQRGVWPSFDVGGVVPGPPGAPMPAIVHGGETILPTNQPETGGQPPVVQFLTSLAALLTGAGSSGAPPPPAPPAGINDPAAALAGQAAAAVGAMPAAAANPMLPGSAAPGVPPAAAAAEASARPLAPDGSPYATPADVERIFGRTPQPVP